MTPKQAAFVDEYLVDFNATQAAIRAGYSERSAYNIGYTTLRHPEVALALEARLHAAAIDPAVAGVGHLDRSVAPAEAPIARAAEDPEAASDVAKLSQGWVLSQLMTIVDRCMCEVPVRDRAGRETGEWTFKPREALSALTLIGKHLGMFSARLDVRFLREQAEAVAAEYDLDADEVIEEARRWLQGRR